MQLTNSVRLYRPAKVAAVVGLLVAFGPNLAEACGPYLPERALASPKRFALNAPDASFRDEIARLTPLPVATSKSGRSWIDTEGAESKDLTGQFGAQVAAEVRAFRGGTANHLPESLTPEHRLYVEGAVAYHRQDMAQARRKWSKLLGLPAAERMHRSTWAAYMLARVGEHSRYQEVIELSKVGFHDALNLASASLGEQALLHYMKEDYHEAFELYAMQSARGDGSGTSSLILLSRRILAEPLGSSILTRAAADPLIQQIITAYLVSRGQSSLFDLDVPHPYLVRWLTAVKPSAPGLDRLAWLAYRAGRYSTAAQLLDGGPDTQVSSWIRSKLYLRDGRPERALESLSRALHTETSWTDHARAELALLQLSRRDFARTLDLFLEGNYWMDAAYVAERVLTIDELKTYIDRHRHQGPRLADLRYLLARRLTREGRALEGLDYIPIQHRGHLERYFLWRELARDPTRPTQLRVQAFANAAKIAREQGMELMGTEGAPDFAVWSGTFETSAIPALRGQLKDDLFAPLGEELKRSASSAPAPSYRFHYRYVAAELLREGANLLPSESETAMIMLCWGWKWHIKRDSGYSSTFYREFLRRNYLWPWAGGFGDCPPLE